MAITEPQHDCDCDREPETRIVIIAIAETEHKDMCLETRLIEHHISQTATTTAVAQHEIVGSDNRSSREPTE